MPDDAPPLSFANLRRAYAEGMTPRALIEALRPALAASEGDAVWISRFGPADLLARAAELEAWPEARRGPLWGVPFAVKDNIDVLGLPTTAACPSFAYQPAAHATAVRRLLEQGAICVGKTNLDQFATGLVGVRTPHGAARNPLAPDRVPGGSSSGSAAAVAMGLVGFALGTDTAGSGRIPAGFTNTVGLKPTRGLVPTTGVVPACRSLDCVSVFALEVADAASVLEAMAGPDGEDPLARAGRQLAFAEPLRLGVPQPSAMQWLEADDGYAAAWAAWLAAAQAGAAREVDVAPLLAAAELLYAGPWLAERLAAVGDFLLERPGEVWSVTREVIEGGRRFSAVDAFRGRYRLAELRAAARAMFEAIDVLVVPTAPGHPTLAAVAAEPLAVNARLGLWTNFVNLLDLAAVAVPWSMTDAGLPFGLTLIAPAFHDRALAGLAQRLHRASGLSLGATGAPQVAAPPSLPAEEGGEVLLFVVGAHLRGEPLHGELQQLGGRFAGAARTAGCYRLFALQGTFPEKPGLVRGETGAAIAGELWRLDPAAFGRFVAAVPAPMTIGTVELEDGRAVKGFGCEPSALPGAREITGFGGWRAYRASTG